MDTSQASNSATFASRVQCACRPKITPIVFTAACAAPDSASGEALGSAGSSRLPPPAAQMALRAGPCSTSLPSTAAAWQHMLPPRLAAAARRKLLRSWRVRADERDQGDDAAPRGELGRRGRLGRHGGEQLQRGRAQHGRGAYVGEQRCQRGHEPRAAQHAAHLRKA